MTTPLCHLDPLHFQFMVERAGQEIYLVQRDGTLAFVNEAAARSVGYSTAELTGAHLSLIDPNYGPRFAAHFDELATKDLPVFETTHHAKDGRLVAKEMRSVYLCIGEHGFICGYGQDITERKASAALRHEAQKMEAVGRLAGGVSHDFNNLLTAILGYAETIGMRLPAHDPNAADAREIKAAAQRAASLTQQLLAFGRQQRSEPQPLDLSTVVQRTLRLLQRIIGEDIEVCFTRSDDPHWICADPSQIDQVLVNLAANARDAMPNGGTLTIDLGSGSCPEVAAIHGEGPHADRFVVLTVSDTGHGMSADTRSHIFEPFFTTKEPGKGTGLGLATVYAVVEQNRGVITVDSEPGLGTTFHVRFPAVEPPRGTPMGSQPASASHGGNETVLLVEDEPVVSKLARLVLEENGYKVISADSPMAAIEICRLEPREIDLLLTDVVMPEMNGVALFDAIHRLRPETAVLFMSGYPGDALTKQGLLDKNAMLLCKPFTVDELSAKVREALERRGS